MFLFLKNRKIMISERILIIDDDQRVIRSLRMILSKYELIEFTDGTKAIEYLKRPRDISLVLLDVMMPQIDGLQILLEIKEIYSDMSVIIMTAYATKDVAVEALRLHADDFIEKPFNTDELQEKVSKLLKKKLYFTKNVSTKSCRIERIKKFIKRNFDKASLSSIAEIMCLSPKYVSRMFKEQEGISFREFLLDIKMKEARNLLKLTNISIDDLSYRLGYQNAESFMRIFKRIHKKTPTEYRLLVK